MRNRNSNSIFKHDRLCCFDKRVSCNKVAHKIGVLSAICTVQGEGLKNPK